MKKVEDMTLAEIKEHQKINSEIAAAISRPVISGVLQAGEGSFSSYIGKYVIVRTYTAGVFAGILKAKCGKEVEMESARRLWYWDGAASLSQLANEGVKNPSNCKFAQPVIVNLLEAIEILPVSDAARKNIEAVKVWQQ